MSDHEKHEKHEEKKDKRKKWERRSVERNEHSEERKEHKERKQKVRHNILSKTKEKVEEVILIAKTSHDRLDGLRGVLLMCVAILILGLLIL